MTGSGMQQEPGMAARTIRGQAANARSGLVPTGGGPADVAGAVIWRRGEG